MDQPEYVHIELCEAIADEHFTQSIGRNWVKAWPQSPIKCRILYEKEEPFIINPPTNNLAVKGFLILLHSYAEQRKTLHLNNKSEMRLRMSDQQPRMSTPNFNSHEARTRNMFPKDCCMITNKY